VALDAEEDSSYERLTMAYISGMGDPKKMPRHPREGYSYTPDSQSTKDGWNVFRTPNVIEKVVQAGVNIRGKKGSVDEIARIKGWKKVYRHADGTITDVDGNIIEQRSGSTFIPSAQGESSALDKEGA